MEKDNDPRDVVLITGSNGLIGSALTRALLDQYRVVGLDRDPPSDSPPGFEWHRCDLTDPEKLRIVLEAVRRDHGKRLASVVHLAAYYDFRGKPSPLYDKLTVRATGWLLRLLQAFDVEQFVFSSTLLVMRPSDNGELTEESPMQAEWDYPESKIRAEERIRERRGEIPAVILRIAGIYDGDCHSPPIAHQISRIHKKELVSYFFPGDARRGQSFLHLDDVVEAIRRSIQHRRDLAPEEVFLIGEPDVMSYEELQEDIGKLLHGQEWPAIRIPRPIAKAGAWVREKLSDDDGPFIQPWMIDLADAHYPVSIERARERLGWEPRHRLRDFLPEMIRRLEEDPQRWYDENGIDPPDDSSFGSSSSSSEPPPGARRERAAQESGRQGKGREGGA